MSYQSIKTADIKVGMNWSRDGEGDVSSLKESLRQHGLQQPIIVNEDYNLVAGFRRLKAAKELGWEEIDARIITVDPEVASAINLIENLERENLTFYEECLAIKRLFADCSEQQVADFLNRTRGWSRPRIKLWSLGDDIIAMAKTGKITSSQVTGLLNKPNTKEACEHFAQKGSVEKSSTKPGKKEVQAAITVCLERNLVDIAHALRWVLGDIDEEEFWDNVQRND